MIFYRICLLYTSDAADERSSVDLGGRRIIKKKILNNKNFVLRVINTIYECQLDQHKASKKTSN